MKTIVTQIRQKRLMALVLFLLVGMTSVFAQKQTISLEKSNERGKIMMAALVFNDL